ncbi:MAG TPA: NTP transferase domain-containing protein, partial [Terracidiphilus sp.]
IPVHNDRWRQGIASSIEAGVRALSVCAPEAEGVLLMGCDQPRLTADHLGALITAFEGQAGEGQAGEGQAGAVIAASSYAGVQAAPAVFPRSTFAGLRALQGDRGARSVIESAPCPVVAMEFPGGEVDIDSPEDLAALE